MNNIKKMMSLKIMIGYHLYRFRTYLTNKNKGTNWYPYYNLSEYYQILYP